MEEIKNKNNKTKNESELIETTNPYILELCDDQGNKKIVPVLPVANFTGLTSNTFANLDNTCMTNRILFDQLDPLWALKRPINFHPITKEKYNVLEFENKQILTFFGYPSDFFVRIKKDINDMYGDAIKFIKKNGSRKIRILNSFFSGNGDDDTVGVDFDFENNIIFNFVKDTDYEIKNSNDIKERMHRAAIVRYSDGTARKYYLPIFIDEEEIPRSDDDRFHGNKVFWKNMNQILEQPMYENLKSSDLDFIKEFIDFDDFFTIKDKGDDSTEYFAIVEKQESCKTVEDPEKNFCKGARNLVNNILKSEECKALNEKGFKISKSSIYDALMEVSTLGCESTLAYPKIVPEELELKLNLAERTELAKKEFLNAIKEQIAKKHKVRIYKQENEIWDWEGNDKLVNSENIYSVTNYWQAVISSVFLKFRHLDKEKRQIIFYNFVNCYESMKSKKQDMMDYFSKNLDSSFGYKTPILIKKLMENTDLLLKEEDWSDLAKSICNILEMLNFADHATQMFFFEKLESKDKFDDLFLIHNNKLIVQIPELVKLLLEKYNLPPKYYKYNCLVDTELIHSDNSNKGLITSCKGEVSKISEFKFHYDGLPYIFGISRKSLKRFIDNFEDVEDYGFCRITGSFRVDRNRQEYYSRLGSFFSTFCVKQYINSIICSLSETGIDRLYYLGRILPENFWSKSGFIDYYFLEKNSLGISDLEKIISIINIAEYNYGLLDKMFESLLTSKNVSCSLISDIVKIIFDKGRQKVSDYKKMINEKDKNHNNIECVLSYKTYSYYKKSLWSDDTVKFIEINLNGYLLEIPKRLNENSKSKISLFIEKSTNCMYDRESLKPVEIVFSEDELSLNEVDEPIKLDTGIIPGLENSFKIASIKLEINYYKTLFIKFLGKTLSNSSYERDVFESIDNFLIEKNKNEYDLFKSMISENAFSYEEYANLFKYFSLKSEKFILENLDYYFVKWYISKISEHETIEKIILETQKFPDKTAKKLLKRLIKFNSKFLYVLRETEIYKSVKESYNFEKIKEESKERKKKVVVADYSNSYHKDLFDDTCTDSDELPENEKTENTKHNIKEENNCSEQKKSVRSYMYNLVCRDNGDIKPKNDGANKHDANEKEEIK